MSLSTVLLQLPRPPLGRRDTTQEQFFSGNASMNVKHATVFTSFFHSLRNSFSAPKSHHDFSLLLCPLLLLFSSELLEQRAPPSPLKPSSTWTQHYYYQKKASSSNQSYLLQSRAYPQEKKLLLISLSVIEACRECSIAYLGGADPINHSTLHHFRCVSAVHLPYSEHPRGALSTSAITQVFCSPGAVSNCQLWVMSVCYLSASPSLRVLSL